MDLICNRIFVFAGITAILAKCGIQKTDSDVATAVRTIVVLLFSWLMVLVTGTVSGIATGASWLCYYRALQEGPASVVVPIDKLSIFVTIAFSWIVFHEKLTRKSAVGVMLITRPHRFGKTLGMSMLRSFF